MKKLDISKLVLAGLFTALGVLLPIAFHGIPQSWTLLPMHLPILLCGLICGALYGGIAGAVTVTLSSLLTGMPASFTAVYMAFELAAYGVAAGLLARKFTLDKPLSVYIALIGSMLAGRVVLGVVQSVMFGVLALGGRAFGMSAFLVSAFVTPWLGIVIQIVLIPVIILALRRAKLLPLGASRGQAIG